MSGRAATVDRYLRAHRKYSGGSRPPFGYRRVVGPWSGGPVNRPRYVYDVPTASLLLVAAVVGLVELAAAAWWLLKLAGRVAWPLTTAAARIVWGLAAQPWRQLRRFWRRARAAWGVLAQ